MKIATIVVIDIETGKIVSRETFDYTGPLAYAKGPSALQKQTGQAAYSTAGGLQGNASNLNQFLVPQLESDVTNPQGFGQLGLNDILTNEGQAVAGQIGAGNEAATLRASRLGNPNSTTALQDALARTGTTAMSNNSRDAAIQNLKAKIGQRAEGLQGLTGLEKSQQSAALDALGLSNTTQKDIAQEEQAAFDSTLGQFMKPAAGIAGGLANVGLGALLG